MPVPDVNSPKVWKALSTKSMVGFQEDEIHDPRTLRIVHGTRLRDFLGFSVFRRTERRICGQS